MGDKKCEGCKHVIKIFKSCRSLHDIDSVIYRCSLGKNKETCGHTIEKEPISAEIMGTVTEDKSAADKILSQQEIDKIIATGGKL